MSIELPEWVDKDAWSGFEEMRKKVRKPLTDYARKLAINRLIALYHEGNDPTAVLEQSILNAWQGLWPVSRSRDDEARREARVGQGPVTRKCQ